MKRSFLFLTLVAFAMTVLATTDIDVISRQWRESTLDVHGGGQSPDIIALLKAFNHKFPTPAVNRLIDPPSDLKDGQPYDCDDESAMLIDRRNGFAYFIGNDGVQMETCVWRRTNGHRLFAISLLRENDMSQCLLCWYDYDPATQTLHPETSPIDEFQPQFKPSKLECSLPWEGTDFVLFEYYKHLNLKISHVYQWDGMRHRYSHTFIDSFRYQWFADGDWQISSDEEVGYCQYALIDPLGNGLPLFCLRKAPEPSGQDAEYSVFAQFKGNMQTVAISDGLHQFNGFFTVQPEDDAPWKATDLVAFTRDFMQNGFYAVIRDGRISYFVNDIPFEEDGERGHRTEVIGNGSDEESIHIIHANIAREIEIAPEWREFQFNQ